MVCGSVTTALASLTWPWRQVLSWPPPSYCVSHPGLSTILSAYGCLPALLSSGSLALREGFPLPLPQCLTAVPCLPPFGHGFLGIRVAPPLSLFLLLVSEPLLGLCKDSFIRDLAQFDHKFFCSLGRFFLAHHRADPEGAALILPAIKS